MNRLVLIDGHAILHRAYHALPPLTTSKGEIVNAVYGFSSMLLRVIADLKPTHIAVAFDTPEPTFRNKLFKDYQIQRPKVDEEFIPQIDLVKKLVREMGIPTFEKVGFEADDVIGTLAKKADVDEVVIVTGDRDILQLVDDKIGVYMPVKGLSQSKLYGEKEVEEKFGIKVTQIIDYKALVGDPADNYPGVSGIGPKTAASLLSRFKTLEQLYEQVHKVESVKVRKALNENKESAEMAKKLATIVTNIPIEIDLDKCQLKNFDRPNVHHLFEELEFRSLIPRLGSKIKEQKTKNKEQKTEKKEDEKIQQTSLF